MKLWLAVAGVLAVVSSPCSAFLYPDEDDSMIPGVRPRPTSGNPGGTSIRFPDTSSVTRGALAPVPVPDQQPATVDLHAVSASESAKGADVLFRITFNACLQRRKIKHPGKSKQPSSGHSSLPGTLGGYCFGAQREQ